MIDLKDLRIFVEVAKCGSFAHVARSHRLSPSQISTQISKLERELGALLFYRNSRNVRLTLEGEMAFQRASRIIDHAMSCTHAADRRPGLEGHVTIEASTAMYRAVLRGALAKISAKNPKLKIELNHRPFDGPSAGMRCDIFIDFDNPRASARSAPLNSYRSMTLVSPSYLEKYGRPSCPRHLTEHRCLPYVDYRNGRTFPWTFRKETDAFSFIPGGNLVMDYADGAIHAAELGLGIVHTADVVLNRQVADGTLVEILEDWAVVYPPWNIALAQDSANDSCAISVFEKIVAYNRSSREDFMPMASSELFHEYN